MTVSSGIGSGRSVTGDEVAHLHRVREGGLARSELADDDRLLAPLLHVLPDTGRRVDRSVREGRARGDLVAAVEDPPEAVPVQVDRVDVPVRPHGDADEEHEGQRRLAVEERLAEVTAGDIQLAQGYEILNPDQVICTLDKKTKRFA